MSTPKEIFVKLDRCTGCQSCVIACTVEHTKSKSLYAALQEIPKPKSRIYVQYVAPDHKVPIVCRQCEDAPCMHACISGAIRRTAEGVVFTETDKCIGCWTCVMVCPYGVIGRHLETHKAYRCDRCPDRKTPACVEACPTGALTYEDVETYSREVRQAVSKEMTAKEGS